MIIKSAEISGNGCIEIRFYDRTREYKMKFVNKMIPLIMRNIYYNSTGKYYYEMSFDDWKSEVIGKSVIGISNNDDGIINQTRPIKQTENQTYRDSEEWNKLKQNVAELHNYTCDGCGFHFIDKSFEVHHQDYYIGSNIEYTDKNPDRYRLYCRKCHQNVHNKL